MKWNSNIKTPCFVVDTKKSDLLIKDLKKSLYTYYPEGIIGYSFKTNNTPWIISYMKNKGLYAEVVSSDEFCLARELGYEFNEIIFNGPVKGKTEFIQAVNSGTIVNIDSKRELEWLLECDKQKIKNSKIGLRVNFCLEEYCPGESQCGVEDGRFGFSYEMGELKRAIEFLDEKEIPLSGLHLHCSSKTRSVNIYDGIAKVAVDIVREYGLHLVYLDIGGGFFGGVEGKPKFQDYFSKVNSILNSEPYLKNVKLIVEPGMSVIGASMSYITSVIDTKITKNNSFAILDGSRIHIDPLMKKRGYSYHIKRISTDIKDEKVSNQILCGFTCMESDRFFKLTENDVSVGDLIVFEKVGAYTIGLSPQFIEFHPDIYEEKDGELILVQSKRTANEFIK